MGNICDYLREGKDDTQSCCPFEHFMKRVTHPTGTYLYRQGEPITNLFNLHSGMVALERILPDGEMVITKLIQPGGLFPLSGAWQGGTYAHSARTLTQSSLCLIPAEGMNAVAREDPHTAFCLFRRGCEDIGQNEEAITILLGAGLPERTLALLADLGRTRALPSEDGKLHFRLPVSWHIIASALGTRREVLSRLLRKLSESGALAYSNRDVTLNGWPDQRAALPLDENPQFQSQQGQGHDTSRVPL
jgi:CRP/FNR family transcriptional regulator